MVRKKFKDSLYYIFIALIFILFSLFIEYSVYALKKEIKENQSTQSKEIALKIATYLEKEISYNLYLIQGLKSYIVSMNGRIDPNITKKVLEFSYKETRNARLIAIAPNDIIKYVYPLRRNEKILGMDYKTIPNQWASIEKSIQSRKPFLSDPFELIQGGMGIIYRIPIFLTNGSYWGVMSIVTDVDKLLNEKILSGFVQEGYDLYIISNNKILLGDKSKSLDWDNLVSVSLATSDIKIAINRNSKISIREDKLSIILIRIFGWGFNILSCALLLNFYHENKLRKKMQQELIKAKELAESANIAKSHFLANMSHEIRTPLNAVLGFTQIMQESAKTIEDIDYLKKISDAGKYLLYILNDILDFSQIEANQVTLNLASEKITDAIEETNMILNFQAGKKQIDYITSIDPTLKEKYFMLDSIRLRQILLNVIGNAIKYTDNGKVEFECRILTETESTDHVYFSVKDTGIGITEKEIGQIFNIFYRGNSNKTKNFQGTGLGLVISKRLVELMGGKIFVSSVHNQGSHFYFTLPLEKAPIPNQIEIQPNPETNTALEPHRILVVEDNILNQIVTKRMLNLLSQNVLIANNGLEAIDILEKDPNIDLIFMDISMPILDGIEATKIIRSKNKYKNLPIVALSAHVATEDKKKYLATGMNDHLSKPVYKEDLKRILKKYLET